MSESRERARALVDTLVTAYNARDIDTLAALYRDDVTYWSAIGGEQVGRDEVVGHLHELHERLPDEQMRAETVVTDGDVVVVEFESTGTSPAGEPYSLRFTEVFTLDDGRIAAIKVYLDPEQVAAITG